MNKKSSFGKSSSPNQKLSKKTFRINWSFRSRPRQCDRAFMLVVPTFSFFSFMEMTHSWKNKVSRSHLALIHEDFMKGTLVFGPSCLRPLCYHTTIFAYILRCVHIVVKWGSSLKYISTATVGEIKDIPFRLT